MSMHDQALSQRIWNDDQSVLGEAYRRFEADPEKQLIPWASTLYSFRTIPECRSALLDLMPELAERAEQSQSLTVDECDCLSTYFLWAARTGDTRVSANACLGRANTIAKYGFKMAVETEERGDHSAALLALTIALWYLTIRPSDWRTRVDTWLEAVVARAPYIIDQNQKIRVYRKLGALQLKLGRPLAGVTSILTALTIKGAKGPRRKTLFFWKQ